MTRCEENVWIKKVKSQANGKISEIFLRNVPKLKFWILSIAPTVAASLRHCDNVFQIFPTYPGKTYISHQVFLMSSQIKTQHWLHCSIRGGHWVRQHFNKALLKSHGLKGSNVGEREAWNCPSPKPKQNNNNRKPAGFLVTAFDPGLETAENYYVRPSELH